MDRSIIREIGFRDWLWRKGMRQFYRHLLKRPHLMDLPTGNRFALPIWSAFASEVFVSHSNVDWGSEALLCRLIRGRGAFLDVGANIGYYSVYMQPVVEQVFAFEPDPYARLHLNANVGSLPRISVVSCAVGPETTVARFVRSGRTQLSRLASQREFGVDVPVVSIDDFVGHRSLIVGGIKTKIRGQDLGALLGARQVLQRQRPVVLSELQPSPELADLTRGNDYAIFAYGREPASGSIRFVRVDALEARGLEFKMLFLVPEERGEEIRAAA